MNARSPVVVVLCALWMLAPPPAASGQDDVAPLRCPLAFYVEDPRIPPVSIGTLVFDVGYSPPGLQFAGAGADVECTSLLAGATAAFDDDEDDGRVRLDLRSSTGINSLLQLLARCVTVSATPPTAGDFTITLVEQTALAGGDVSPPVAVRLLFAEIEECESWTSTTTTTTTMPDPDGECGDPTNDGAVTATDALFTLNAAVGIVECEVCVCDADGSGSVTASDALALLAAAVGQGGELRCAPCSAAAIH